MQLDVEPVRRAARELRDPVALLEAEDEELACVVDRIDLVEAEAEGRRQQPKSDCAATIRRAS